MNEGIYELIINAAIKSELEKNNNAIKKTRDLTKTSASDVLSKYVYEIIKDKLNTLDNSSDEKIEEKINLVNNIINSIDSDNYEELKILTHEVKKNTQAEKSYNTASQLLSLLNNKNSLFVYNNKEIPVPMSSIAECSLFTGGADNEPPLFEELKKEIVTSNKIDMLVSFIRWSGLRLILPNLRTFTERGGLLRIITTTYMGATDPKAIDELSKLPNTEIKISYDTKRTRLHAKAYMFYRDTGFSTAYVGSSNLSNPAMSSGMEWNIKIAKKELPETLEKVKATFETYWNNDKEFEIFSGSEDEFRKLCEAISFEKNRKKLDSKDLRDNPYILEITPYPYQQAILDNLKTEREVHHRYKNLVVTSTGTGKTVIAAFDYKNYCKEYLKQTKKKYAKLLFIAHRKEILEQSRAKFREILRDQNFGELFVGTFKPQGNEQLFMSIQTFNSQDWTSRVPADYYDFIIVDEFHHAKAKSYQALLEYFTPKILLGLTATPERMDRKDVTEYFGGRIAAEIRLPEAIERKLLCPFHYFGVTDTESASLVNIDWRRGKYDEKQLENIYSSDKAIAEQRAQLIYDSVMKYVTDINDVVGLGFCVTKKHARFMSEQFNKRGIKSEALISDTQNDDRKEIRARLVNDDKDRIKFLFVVDLFNEGVDIPEINTILFLRPTESLTVFIQQLGRGLRLCDGKECLTVLDFVAQSRKKYSINENKLRILLPHLKHPIKQEIQAGFTAVPKGCYIQLEKQAQDYILDTISEPIGSKSWIEAKLQILKEEGVRDIALKQFLEIFDLDIKSLYKKSNSNPRSFSKFCANVGFRPSFTEPDEKMMCIGFSRICSINSEKWLNFLVKDLLISNKTIDDYDDIQRLYIEMFYFTMWTNASDIGGDAELNKIRALKNNPVLYKEMIEILNYQLDTINFVAKEVDLGYNHPLQVHCNYSRDQLLVGLGHKNPSNMRQGVFYLEDKKTDIFLITLNKNVDYYKESIQYNDYSISEYIFHWESQNATSPESKQGKRYINHDKLGSKILLFVRDENDDKTGNRAPYTFLGTAHYIRHENSKPMAIYFRLDVPIPGELMNVTNKLLAS